VRRALPVAVLMGSLLITASGCGLLAEEHEVTFEVTGSGGPAQTIDYSVPGDTGNAARNVTLPWTTTRTSAYGIMNVQATPSKDTALTCRIVADGNEIAKTVGKPGKKVECHKIVNDKE
jgi:hypothetical protein